MGLLGLTWFYSKPHKLLTVRSDVSSFVKYIYSLNETDKFRVNHDQILEKN